jgi:hypothetical protein
VSQPSGLGKTKFYPIPLADIAIGGELAEMLNVLDKRLRDPYFHHDSLITWFTHESCPGDAYGRTLLAWVLLAQALKKPNPHLQTLIERLPEHINSEGYFGALHSDIETDETRLTSHNFLVRGLCEYTEWSKDRSVIPIIEAIARRLYLPLRQTIASYPDHCDRRFIQRREALVGMEEGIVGRWRVSTDTGSLFFSLDGLSHVLRLMPGQEIEETAASLVDRFALLDGVELKMHTHSYLSACRGLLRLYEALGKDRYLELAKERFAIYKQRAWTADYQNWNWFSRPVWTEGCAVIDSFILATQLWQLTGDVAELQDAHRIYWNGLRHNQWPNGGYGTTTCLGADGNPFLRYGEEATWCCTMRGAEGLTWAARCSTFVADEMIVIPFFFANRLQLVFPDGHMAVEQETLYPNSGKTVLTVRQSDVQKRKIIAFFIPEWVDCSSIRLVVNGRSIATKVDSGFLTLDKRFQTGDQITLTFAIGLRRTHADQTGGESGWQTFFHGPLMLGCRTETERFIPAQPQWRHQGDATYCLADGSMQLQPVDYRSFGGEQEAKKAQVQFLFKQK